MAFEATLHAIEAVEQVIFEDALPLRQREKYLQNIREQKREGKKWIKKMRRAIVSLRKLQTETATENLERIEKECPDHVKQVLCAGGRTRNVVALEKLLQQIGHPDETLIMRILKGFPSIGSADRTGVWLENDSIPIPKEEVVRFWQAAVVLKTKKPVGFEDEHLDAIIAGLEDDVREGRMLEVQPSDLVAPPAYLFPKVEATKIRRLLDARPQNVYSNMLEKLKLWGSRQHFETIEAYRAENEELACPAVQTARDTHKAMEKRRKLNEDARSSAGEGRQTKAGSIRDAQRNWAKCCNRVKQRNTAAAAACTDGTLPECGSDDFALAYYQFGVERPELNAIGAYCNSAKSYRFFFARCLQMGNLLSVPAFCRISEAVMGICIAQGLPALCYIDDTVYFTANKKQAAVAKEYFHTLCECLGLVMSSKASADQCSTRPGNAVKSLGIQYDWTRDANGVAQAITISIPAEKREKAVAALNKVIEQADRDTPSKITINAIEQAIGIASWVTRASAWFRCGAEPWRFMYEFLGDERKFQRMCSDKALRARLWKVARAAREFVLATRPTIVKREGQLSRSAVMWTDASTDGGVGGVPRIGAVIILPDGSCRSYTRDMAPEECEALGIEREPRIETLELIGTAVAIALWGHLLERVVLWSNVDSTTQLYALVKLQGKRASTANLALSTSKILQQANARSFWRYERSPWNVADWTWTTREDYDGLVGAVLIAARDDASHIGIAELLACSGHASAKDGSTGLSAPSP